VLPVLCNSKAVNRFTFNKTAQLFRPVKPLGGFSLAQKDESNASYTLGVERAWFVGNSRDYLAAYEDGQFFGYKVHNSCGSFVLAVKMPDKDFLIDSDSALRALGVVNITSIGSENCWRRLKTDHLERFVPIEY